MILRGGRVYTVDAGRPWAEAVAVQGDTLLAVGSNTEMDRFIGQDTSVVELDGRLVLPGFIDSHLHFLDGSFGLDQILLHDAGSLEDIHDIVRVYADNHPERPWILGNGWIYSQIRDGELPTRSDLDEVISDRPVFLTAYDGHTGWANTMALELAEIDRRSQAEGYGEIVKDPATGEPTGILKEDGAMNRVSLAIPSPSRELRLEALRRGIAYAHRFGVTSVHTAGGSPDSDADELPWGDYLDLFEELEGNGELTLRVYFSMLVDQETTDEDLERFSRIKARLPGPWIRAGAVKIFMDGVIESHTAAMLEPYSDDPTTAGSTEHGREAIDELISRVDRHGLQIFTHAIGDRAVRMVLDAYEKVSRAHRHRIEHIEVVSEDDMPRFASLEVIASMQPQHASPEITEVWERSVGRRRAERGFAWKSLTAAGARLALGSDWPVVDLDPLLGIYTAVTREDLRGRPEGGWIPDERLSLEEAIYGYTLGGAYASFDETIKGSVEPGKLADLVVLTDDLFKIPYPRIPHTEAAMTVVGGKVIFVSPSFLPQEMRENLLGRERQQ